MGGCGCQGSAYGPAKCCHDHLKMDWHVCSGNTRRPPTSPMHDPATHASIVRAFAALPHCVPDALAALFTPRAVERGQPLLRQGELWDKAFVIHSGLLRMCFTRRDGREFNKNFHSEGMLVCPITDAMAQQPSLFSIHAVQVSTVLQASAQAMRECLGRDNAWEPLRALLLERLVTHKLEREHLLLAMDGRSRYAHFCRTAPHLAERVPLAQLATYLGMTDVSLSRIRRTPEKP